MEVSRRLSSPRLALALALAFSACGDDAQPTDVTPEACDPTHRPIVMVHGFLASGDTWASFAKRFIANGYCPESLYALDYDSLSRVGAEEALDALIDRALAETGAEQVDLVGHSAGGSISYRYLRVPSQAAKVEVYAHLASSPNPIEGVEPGPPGPADAPIQTVAIRSLADTIVETEDIPGVLNFTLSDADHYQVATSAKAFEDVFTYFNAGVKPKVKDVPTETAPVIAGKALTLGENVPVAGWTLDVFPVDATTGRRLADTPETSVTIAEDGSFGPINVSPTAHYELFLHGSGLADRPVHYFREPFTVSNRFVRLRALPPPGTLVGALFQSIPFGLGHVDLIAFTESQAVVTGRDTLVVAGETMSTPALTAAERTAIAFFFFDEGEDRESGDEVAAFKDVLQVFLVAVDRYLKAGAVPVTLTFNGRTLVVPSLRSDPDGAIVATFD
jgi:pimeloyl-ACP methyl ester carboxylesterase